MHLIWNEKNTSLCKCTHRPDRLSIHLAAVAWKSQYVHVYTSAGIKLRFNEISEREINHLSHFVAGCERAWSEWTSGSRGRRYIKKQPLTQSAQIWCSGRRGKFPAAAQVSASADKKLKSQWIKLRKIALGERCNALVLNIRSQMYINAVGEAQKALSNDTMALCRCGERNQGAVVFRNAVN